MNIPMKMAGLLALGVAVSGCDKSSYESAPIKLQTESGEVACQLYTVERLMWDEAVFYPPTMTKAQADVICQAEGKRRLEAFKAAQRAKSGKSEGGFLGLFGGKKADS